MSFALGMITGAGLGGTSKSYDDDKKYDVCVTIAIKLLFKCLAENKCNRDNRYDDYHDLNCYKCYTEMNSWIKNAHLNPSRKYSVYYEK